MVPQDLRHRGHLHRTASGGKSLADARELLFRWEQGYAELGGELGAAGLTKHLRAETATLHITEDENPIMSSLKLIPDPQGAIC
jgi:hypothetical protein